MATLRSTQVIAVVLASAMPWHAVAGEPCAWQPPAKPARLFLRDRVAFFRTYYSSSWAACAARPEDKVRVQWFAGNAATATPIDTQEVTLDRSSRDPIHRIETQLFPSNVCEGRTAAPSAKRKLTGLPGQERLSELIPLHVTISATGPLAPLAQQSAAIDYPCPACGNGPRGSLSARVEEDGRLTLEGRLEASWFDCAKQDATLELRAFSGHSEADIARAIQPDFVLGDLEKAFVRQGDSYVLKKTLPRSRLCAGKASAWSFEFWGRGELHRASGGDREVYPVACK
jgi:hypothetical protein